MRFNLNFFNLLLCPNCNSGKLKNVDNNEDYIVNRSPNSVYGNMDDNKVLISVVCVTYNHEKFISILCVD